MHPDQSIENARTLASIMGLPDEEAAVRLGAAIQVTWNPTDPVGAELGDIVVTLLERTFIQVGRPGNPATSAICELRINGAASSTASPAGIQATVDPTGCHIRRDPSIADSTRLEGVVPGILLLLCACYCAALTADAALDFPGGRVAQDGIALRFEDWPGVPLSTFGRPTELGSCHLIGAGAVGNAILYALRFLRVAGSLVVIDPKCVTGGIINRCLWFTEEDIGRPKAQRLAEKSRSFLPNMEIGFFTGTLEEHRVALGGEYECLLVGVDSRRARRGIQEDIPREVFDASTTGVEEIVFHHNRQGTDQACMACIYTETPEERSFEKHVAEKLNVSTVEVCSGFVSSAAAKRIVARYPQLNQAEIEGKAFDTLFRQLCSTDQLVTSEQRQVLAPFAFVSQLAGTIAAIEFFLRRQDPFRSSTFNYWRASPWRDLNIELQQLRKRQVACLTCADPVYLTIAAELWGSLSVSGQ